MENIGNSTFSDCYSLKSITIPKSIKSIKDFAFYQCKNLKSIIISNESLVEYIGKNIKTVQFHPEACAGPLDTDALFDEFEKMMEGK